MKCAAAKSAPAQGEIEADIVIVGAGLVGLTLAAELSGIADLVVLECGGGLDDEAKADFLGAVSTGIDYPFRSTRDVGPGGSTSLWAGYCAVFDALDFESRPWVRGSGWPLQAEALEFWYAKVGRTLNVGDWCFDPATVFDRAGYEPLAVGEGLRPTVWRFGTPTLRLAAEHASELENSGSVRVLDACATDILLDRNHGDVDGIAFSRRNGETGTIRAGTYILGAGGLETARLLLNSDRQMEDGVANSSGAVGKYFMEHPHFRIDHFQLDPRTDFAGWVDRARFGDGHEYLVCLGLQERLLRDEQLLNARAHIFRTPQMPENAPPQLGMFIEQEPNPDSRMDLTDERDIFGLRKLALNWALSDLDIKTVLRTSEIVGDCLLSAGLAHRIGPLDREQMMASVMHSNHQLGTTRMSSDPGAGVVDADCRSHDHPNLYICGGSVFPTVSWANPTVTVLALTYRLADHLRGGEPARGKAQQEVVAND